MSELINNSTVRKETLKELILELHNGVSPEEVERKLVEHLRDVPYGEVVEVEQQLINEGLPAEEVLRFCDVHSKVLEGHIDHAGAKPVPPGHPVDVFLHENKALLAVVENARKLVAELVQSDASQIPSHLLALKAQFNALMDVDKHYRRKENLLFPFLEKYGITGPPKVMWGKHDEIRDLLKASIEALGAEGSVTQDEAQTLAELVLTSALDGVDDMTMKEEAILFPMAMDKLTDIDWYEVAQQTVEIGFCLYDPKVEWKPEGVEVKSKSRAERNTISLPSGSMTTAELLAILNTLPVDLTFVDKNDKVKYFSQGKHRIFDRNRAILNRDVRLCHPPSSVHIVDQIINDFKNGKEESAPFWITLHGKFIHIEYFALRDDEGNYLGTLEVSQDATQLRALDGEQRLLSYAKKNDHDRS